MHKRSPFLGVVVPLALLAGQASVIAHSMVVEHQRCREHGELVHRVLSPGESAAGEAPAAHTDPRRARLTLATLTDGHGHDHCLSITDRRDSLRAPERPVGSLAAMTSTPTAPAAVKARLARGALILLAPKTSPPRIYG
ncbi:MAG TPA: hypothetical protein VFH68_17640 [Polyangia bacterium]|nr:hypothetical protein [Polyangia bacterium]